MSSARKNLVVGKEYAVHPHHRFDETTVHFAHRALYKGLLDEQFQSTSPLIFEMVEPGSANLNSPKPGEEFRLANASKVWMTWETLQFRILQFEGGKTADQVRKELQAALAVMGITRKAYMSVQKTPSTRTTTVNLFGREVLELAERYQTLKEMKNA